MSLKRWIALLLAVSLACGIVLAGCAGTEIVTPPETPSQITGATTPTQESPTQLSKPETPTQETPSTIEGKPDIQTQETSDRILKDITPQEAFDLIQNNQNNPNFIIIDVRTPEEFAEGYIKNAINIDFYAETFRDELDKLDRNQTYLIYCRSGSRSGNTLEVMAELNFRAVYNILGGFNRWQAEGYEWETMKAETTERTASTKDALDWKEVKIPTAMN